MAGSSNQFSYYLGGTSVAVGLSAPVLVSPPQFANFLQFGAITGSTQCYLSPLPTLGSTPAIGVGVLLNSITAGQIAIQGPAKFWLSSVGVTASVSLIWGFSSSYGQSFFP